MNDPIKPHYNVDLQYKFDTVSVTRKISGVMFRVMERLYRLSYSFKASFYRRYLYFNTVGINV